VIGDDRAAVLRGRYTRACVVSFLQVRNMANFKLSRSRLSRLA